MKKAVVISACLVIVALSVFFAYRYKTPKPETPVISSETETSSTQATTEEITVSSTEATSKSKEEKAGENEKESESETRRTILNFIPDGAYTPTAFEAKLFNAVNSERQKRDIPPLNWNDCLHALAKIRSDEAVSSFTHTRPDGRKPSTVLTDKGLSFTLFSECLAKGTKEDDEGVNLLLNGLTKESSQADVILSKDYSYAAVAVTTDSDGTVYASVLLCNP
jgi:uncharacterized protein YkwD